MCGPTSQENALQQSSQNFSSMLQQNYGTLFSKQLDVLNSINKSLSPTLAAGPNQHGFSGDQLAAMQTQAINGAGAANRAAQQAARTYGAGEGGGGTSGVTSGITKQIESSIASQAANNLGDEENKITQADFATGNNNYWRAQGGMDALAAGYSPNAAASGTVSSNQASFGEASTIQQQSQEESQMIAGGLTSLAGSFMGTNFAGQLGGGKIFGPGGAFG